MTSTEFNERYKRVRQVTDGLVCTFHAVASTGAVVMVHVLDPKRTAEHPQILEPIDHLDPRARDRVVEITDVEGSPVVVTRFLLDFESLEAWLAQHRTPPLSSASDEGGRLKSDADSLQAPSPPPSNEPGEFTRMMKSQGPSAEAGRAPDAGLPVAKPPLEPAPPHPPQATDGEHLPAMAPQEPGEFTRLFRSYGSQPPERAATTPPTPPAESAPVVPTPPVGAPKEPGEFTRMFQSPPPAPPPETPSVAWTAPPPSPPREPSSAPPPPFPPTAPAQPGPTTPPNTPKEPGEFTRYFGKQTGEPPAPGGLGPSFRAPGGEAARPLGEGVEDWRTRLGGAGGGVSGTRPPPAVPGPPGIPSGAAPPRTPAPRSGPGEYTRIFSAAPTPPTPLTPGASPAPFAPPPPKPPSKVLLVGGLAGILVLALLGVVLFVLLADRGQSPPDPTGDPVPSSTAPAGAG